MDERSIRYAEYWRNSLADAESGRGALRSADAKDFRHVSPEALATGRVGHAIVDRMFEGEPDRVELVAVVLRPLVYAARVEHGQIRRGWRPEIVTPLTTPAALARDGRLYPSSDTVVPRDLLEPLGRGSLALGQVAEQDAS